MANKIFYQEDCNLSLLDGKKIAIIGYGDVYKRQEEVYVQILVQARSNIWI